MFQTISQFQNAWSDSLLESSLATAPQLIFIITHGAFGIADPSSMQDACHNELSKYDLARHKSPSNSVVRAPDPCYARSWARFPLGTQNFSLSHARDKLNVPSFSFLSELKIYHLAFLLSHTVFSTLLTLEVCRTRVRQRTL